MVDSNSTSAIEAYLVGLYGSDPHGLLWIGGHADGWRGRTFTTPAEAARYAGELDARGGQGVYHRSTTLAGVPEKRGSADDSAAVYYFALDIDIQGPGHKADNLPASTDDVHRLIIASDFPEPTCWVNSGGGYYPQWRFTEPIDVREPDMRAWVQEAFATMAAHFIAVAGQQGWHLDNVRDLARVFRLPGTTNRKAELHVQAAWGPGCGETYDLGVLASKAMRQTPAMQQNTPITSTVPVEMSVTGDDLFDEPEKVFTDEQATAFVKTAYEKLKGTTNSYNAAINSFAMACAHFPWLFDRERCGKLVIKALGQKTGWTEPDAADRATINSAYSATEAGRSWTATQVGTPADATAAPSQGLDSNRLYVSGPGEMAYWLADEIGQNRLSGFFLRNGVIVHTPRVNEIGYVPAPEGDDNGQVEIRPVTAETAAAKVQFLFDCYKIIKGKKDEPDVEVKALFPTESARRVVGAPESANGLRVLKGITHTPMVRADGSILAEPGYDKASGFLYVPDAGVMPLPVPETPSAAEVADAVALLHAMVAGFPFAGDDDRANYLGLLLTPLLRLIAPPSYKMFGIGAHQPGSGKSLLAETVALVHGAVTRSEVPEDEGEWRKMTMSLLATTSAPVCVLDNVTGVLRSSVLAGLLTASGEIQDRELGKSSMITTRNDRVWVVTGNNLSLGGDLVRRTVTILIDPDMAAPETRTGFAIQDLPGWVRANRNRLLWSLLVLVRHWVVKGMPLEERRQSDSFATWECMVGGILAAAGVAGSFDAESGKRAATGGDDDGLLALLERARTMFDDRPWTVAELLTPAGDQFAVADRDWLPSVVLEKLARSEPSGRKSLGRWLMNRRGRWVTDGAGRQLVIRDAGRDDHSKVAMWKVETR